MRQRLALAILAWLSIGCLAVVAADPILSCPGVLTLQNGKIAVGIAPEAGGRVVFFGFPGGGNVLKCDAKRLAAGAAQPRAEAEHWLLNGHEVWVGPQEDFWADQEVNPRRKAAKSTWPPDPWLEMGRYSVARQQPGLLVLEGPLSPVTGLKLRKEVALLEDGGVKLTTEAVNGRATAVSWDLWSNTRLDGRCRSYVACPGGGVRYNTSFWNPAGQAALPFTVEEGYFSFVPPAATSGKEYMGKAFLSTGAEAICAFGKDFLFLKRFPAVPASEVHKTQAPIEIFQDYFGDAESGLLELEFHGAYRKLEPGQSMTIIETWSLQPYQGENTPEAHRKFLRALLPAAQ